MDNQGGVGKGIINITVENAPAPDLQLENVNVMDLPYEKIFSFFVNNFCN